MDTIEAKERLRVTVASAPMVGAKDFNLPFKRQTLTGIVRAAIDRNAVPDRFWSHGRITVDGMPVLTEHWSRVRPKPGLHVHLWIPPGFEGLALGFSTFFLSAGAPLSVGIAAYSVASAALPFAIGVIGTTGHQTLFEGAA